MLKTRNRASIAFVMTKCRFKETSLHKAVRSGNLEIVKILVDMGADLQVKGAQGTPKELAASLVSLGSSRIDIYKFLGNETSFVVLTGFF